MPSWIVKQPNGNYCRYSTIVDGICEYDGGRDWWWNKLHDDGGIEHANKKLENADNEGITANSDGGSRPPLTRWNEAVEDSIAHIRFEGNDPERIAELKKIIIACGDDPARWADEFAKPVEEKKDE